MTMQLHVWAVMRECSHAYGFALFVVRLVCFRRQALCLQSMHTSAVRISNRSTRPNRATRSNWHPKKNTDSAPVQHSGGATSAMRECGLMLQNAQISRDALGSTWIKVFDEQARHWLRIETLRAMLHLFIKRIDPRQSTRFRTCTRYYSPQLDKSVCDKIRAWNKMLASRTRYCYNIILLSTTRYKRLWRDKGVEQDTAKTRQDTITTYYYSPQQDTSMHNNTIACNKTLSQNKTLPPMSRCYPFSWYYF